MWLVDRILPAEDADALLQNLKTLALPEEALALQKDAARIPSLPAQRYPSAYGAEIGASTAVSI